MNFFLLIINVFSYSRLKEAEEESEDDTDEDVELEFDERAKISTLKQKVSPYLFFLKPLLLLVVGSTYFFMTSNSFFSHLG